MIKCCSTQPSKYKVWKMLKTVISSLISLFVFCRRCWMFISLFRTFPYKIRHQGTRNTSPALIGTNLSHSNPIPDSLKTSFFYHPPPPPPPPPPTHTHTRTKQKANICTPCVPMFLMSFVLVIHSSFRGFRVYARSFPLLNYRTERRLIV